MKTCWESYKVNGNAIWTLKEKLKRVKLDLKVWNKEIFGDMYKSKERIISSISKLDKRDEESDLDQMGREERSILFADLKKINFKLEALEKQKARAKWLEAGDMNTKYFHRLIKWRRIKNMIKVLNIDNDWCENPIKVKHEIRCQFKNRFTEHNNMNYKA